jgi:metallo-beta-lactamase family protein
MSFPSLAFFGATRTVTGSKTLVDSGGTSVLVDCGLFQGERAWRQRNWMPPPVDPASIDAVVITHAHLDHCGYLPVLVREGFAGPVICSQETAQLMAIVLRDAAHLQEEEARWARTSGLSKHPDPRPLYDTADAERALARLRPVPTAEPWSIGNVGVTLHRAGHILGSRYAVLDVAGTTVAFSGDLGRPDHPLLRAPEALHPVDHVVVESTYGDRRHLPGGTDELGAVLRRALGRGGVALVPAFAVDRTPLLLHEIRSLVAAGTVPDVPVFVDSPMALAALEVYRAALGAGEEYRPEVVAERDPFDPGRLALAHGPDESERLNDPRRPCIVLSASGMAEGGRVLHHLEHQLPRSRNVVVLTGFQVAGTRGRALADGARQVKIHGRYVPVRAEIANLRGFSAHADGDQLVDWVKGAGSPSSVFVVHGEESSATALAHRLDEDLGLVAVAPEYGERVRLG